MSTKPETITVEEAFKIASELCDLLAESYYIEPGGNAPLALMRHNKKLACQECRDSILAYAQTVLTSPPQEPGERETLAEMVARKALEPVGERCWSFKPALVLKDLCEKCGRPKDSHYPSPEMQKAIDSTSEKIRDCFNPTPVEPTYTAMEAAKEMTAEDLDTPLMKGVASKFAPVEPTDIDGLIPNWHEVRCCIGDAIVDAEEAGAPRAKAAMLRLERDGYAVVNAAALATLTKERDALLEACALRAERDEILQEHVALQRLGRG